MSCKYKGFPRPGNRHDIFALYPELKTEVAFVIGNGKSRQDFDLEQLRHLGTLIGCNALYRDFSPDVLVAIDQKMIKEITDAKYWEENLCVVPHNRSAGIPNSLLFKGDKYNTSGCFAMQLVGKGLQSKYCVMLGMDAYPGNVYDSTRNYAQNTLQNFSGVLQYYERVLRDPNIETKYINVNVEDSWTEGCRVSDRYRFLHTNEFKKMINGTVAELVDALDLGFSSSE